jgi:hypothetical protein
MMVPGWFGNLIAAIRQKIFFSIFLLLCNLVSGVPAGYSENVSDWWMRKYVNK